MGGTLESQTRINAAPDDSILNKTGTSQKALMNNFFGDGGNG